MKILLNAEAFGFGPSACISVVFNILKKNCDNIIIDYIGEGHTLDLQKKLSYNQIYTYKNEEQFKEIIKNYDFFMTALDFEKSKMAKESNIKTVFIDTLLWFWKNKPNNEICDFYISQKFFYVQDIFNKLNIENKFLISPLVKLNSEILKQDNDSNNVLINFGGLENPFWEIETTVLYIENILSSLIPVLESKKLNFKIVCSNNHVSHLKKFNAQTLSYNEMQNCLKETSFIIATPGLGNIYEIANYKIPSLFLPPVNDSQGLQLSILRQNNLINNDLDWINFQNSIDYSIEQKNVLNDIKNNIENFNHQLFKNFLENKINQKILYNQDLNKIINLFGINGNKDLKNIILNKILKY